MGLDEDTSCKWTLLRRSGWCQVAPHWSVRHRVSVLRPDAVRPIDAWLPAPLCAIPLDDGSGSGLELSRGPATTDAHREPTPGHTGTRTERPLGKRVVFR